MKITQEEFVTVLNGLTEQDLKETQELVENLREFFGNSLIKTKIDIRKLDSLKALSKDYEDEIFLAVLVSKLSKGV